MAAVVEHFQVIYRATELKMCYFHLLSFKDKASNEQLKPSASGQLQTEQ